MAKSKKRTVGERGQVTLPKELCKQLDIRGGDEVEIRREDNKIVLEKLVTNEDLAEGYRRRAAQNRELTEEWQSTSWRANEYLGGVPSW